jgi:hypothetical protein
MSDPKPNLKKGWNGTPNQATNLFLVPVVERLQVPLHNPAHFTVHTTHTVSFRTEHFCYKLLLP